MTLDGGEKLKITLKTAKNWKDFKEKGNDYGIYWLSFGGYSTYVGIAFKGKSTMFKRWKDDHDYKGKKWARGTAKKKLGKDWTRRINGKDRKAKLSYWKYKKPRAIPSASATSRKKILEAVESVIIFHLAKTRHNKKKKYGDIRYNTPPNATLINSSKVDSSKRIHMNYLIKNLGKSKLNIAGGPRDWIRNNNKTINSLVKPIKKNK